MKGEEATSGGKPKERRSGEEYWKAGKRTRMERRWNWEMRRSLVGWAWYQWPSSWARTASTSEGAAWLMSVSKMTMCLL